MKLYSNEIVFRGHPDKVCDQISDALLDECLKQDKNSRCGIEVMGGKGKVFVTGEVTSKAKLDVESTVKRVLRDVGYSDKYEVIDNLGRQSVDIALGTNDDVEYISLFIERLEEYYYEEKWIFSISFFGTTGNRRIWNGICTRSNEGQCHSDITD